MVKVSPWCGKPSDRGRLKNRNRTELLRMTTCAVVDCRCQSGVWSSKGAALDARWYCIGYVLGPRRIFHLERIWFAASSLDGCRSRVCCQRIYPATPVLFKGWCGGVMVRVLSHGTKGRGFVSRLFHFQVTTSGKLFAHMWLCHQAV